jgi:hypothetical protein
MLLLAPLAFADVAVDTAAGAPCGGAYPTDSLPRPGATDVPVDAQPVVLFAFDACGNDAWTVSLMKGDVRVAHVEENVRDGLAELPLDAPLEPDTAYALVLRDTLAADQHVIGFTTGAASGGPPGEPPAFASFSAAWYADAETMSVAAGVEPGLPEALVQVVDADSAQVMQAQIARGGLYEAGYDVLIASPPAETCAFLRQRDVRGGFLESAVACAEVDVVEAEHEHGICGTPGAAAGLVPAALAMLAGLRRRRA